MELAIYHIMYCVVSHCFCTDGLSFLTHSYCKTERKPVYCFHIAHFFLAYTQKYMPRVAWGLTLHGVGVHTQVAVASDYYGTRLCMYTYVPGPTYASRTVAIGGAGVRMARETIIALCCIVLTVIHCIKIEYFSHEYHSALTAVSPLVSGGGPLSD